MSHLPPYLPIISLQALNFKNENKYSLVLQPLCINSVFVEQGLNRAKAFLLLVLRRPSQDR